MKTTLLIIAATFLSAAKPVAGPDSVLQGNWRNPKGTVVVDIESCGLEVCGKVVRASASAISDARESGYPRLIGMELMQGYRTDGPSHWSGIVFVPDMGRSFSSHIDMIDRNHVRIAGCLFGRYICKSQIWQRA